MRGGVISMFNRRYGNGYEEAYRNGYRDAHRDRYDQRMENSYRNKLDDSSYSRGTFENSRNNYFDHRVGDNMFSDDLSDIKRSIIRDNYDRDFNDRDLSRFNRLHDGNPYNDFY